MTKSKTQSTRRTKTANREVVEICLSDGSSNTDEAKSVEAQDEYKGAGDGQRDVIDVDALPQTTPKQLPSPCPPSSKTQQRASCAPRRSRTELKVLSKRHNWNEGRPRRGLWKHTVPMNKKVYSRFERKFDTVQAESSGDLQKTDDEIEFAKIINRLFTLHTGDRIAASYCVQVILSPKVPILLKRVDQGPKRLWQAILANKAKFNAKQYPPIAAKYKLKGFRQKHQKHLEINIYESKTPIINWNPVECPEQEVQEFTTDPVELIVDTAGLWSSAIENCVTGFDTGAPPLRYRTQRELWAVASEIEGPMPVEHGDVVKGWVEGDWLIVKPKYTSLKYLPVKMNGIIVLRKKIKNESQAKYTLPTTTVPKKEKNIKKRRANGNATSTKMKRHKGEIVGGKDSVLFEYLESIDPNAVLDDYYDENEKVWDEEALKEDIDLVRKTKQTPKKQNPNGKQPNNKSQKINESPKKKQKSKSPQWRSGITDL